jgi:hypothetical protein
MDDFLTAAEKAETAFATRVAALGLTRDDDWAMRAWENAFAAEVHAEYADDAERWDVALSSLNMIADQEDR